MRLNDYSAGVALVKPVNIPAGSDFAKPKRLVRE
jgi:hypothetical protein